MCPLNPALDRVFRIGGSLPSLGDGSTEKIPLLCWLTWSEGPMLKGARGSRGRAG